MISNKDYHQMHKDFIDKEQNNCDQKLIYCQICKQCITKNDDHGAHVVVPKNDRKFQTSHT